LVQFEHSFICIHSHRFRSATGLHKSASLRAQWRIGIGPRADVGISIITRGNIIELTDWSTK
jgi:hypothetical protein